MWSAADPHKFMAMQITVERASDRGRFSERPYGGVWAGQLRWAPLTHHRAAGAEEPGLRQLQDIPAQPSRHSPGQAGTVTPRS